MIKHSNFSVSDFAMAISQDSFPVMLDVFNQNWPNISDLFSTKHGCCLRFHYLPGTTHSWQSLARVPQSSPWVIHIFHHQKQEAPQSSSSYIITSSVTGFSSCLCFGKVFYLVIENTLWKFLIILWLYPSWGRVVHAGGAQNIDYSGLYNHF